MNAIESPPAPFVRTIRVSRRALVTELAVLLLCVAIFTGAFVLDPSPSGRGTHTHLGLPPCGFLLVLQKPCPSCGLTTAFAHMVRGEIGLATRAHPAGPVAFAYILACAVVCTYSLVTERRVVFRNDWAIKTFVGVTILVFMVGALRLLFNGY